MHDIFISGGGPAGVVLAIKLSQAGFDVVLAGVPRRFAALEGLAERGRLALSTTGCSQALAALGPKVFRQASWNGDQFGGNQEWLVERTAFDAALMRDARVHGVDVREQRTGRVERQGDGWLTELAGKTLCACYWVDARGRQAPRTARTRQSPRVLGLSAWWQGNPQPPAAGICTFAHGWCWYARLPDGQINLQVFVDGEHQRPPSRSALRAHYLQLISGCKPASEIVATAVMQAEPFVRDAALTLSRPVIGEHCARTGDAALALDPLAGHGMFEAMALATTLASCIRTELDRPADAELARCFYRTRVEDEYWRLARTGREFYALETRWTQEAFWSRRQCWPDALPSHPEIRPGIAQIDIKPVVVDGYIESREVLTCPDIPRGAWQVAGIPLVELLRLLEPKQRLTRECIGRIATSQHWPLNELRTAIAWLSERRLLGLAQ